ncbi:hypothetical protein Tco_0102835 [Tanacetum coccineum]
MDIRDEIKAFKGDKSTKSSSLPDFGQNKPQNLDTGVKGRIGRVSPMKSKVTGKSDSHKSRWVPMSERVSNQPGDIVLSPQPVSQYNPVTGQVVKESDTAPVVIEKSIGKPDVVKEKPDVVKEKPVVVKEKPVVVKEKPDVVKEKPVVVKEKPDVVKEKPAVVKDCLKLKRKTVKNSKALDNPKETDKVPDVIESDKHKADVVKPSNVVADKAINVVADKAINVVADKVDVAKDKINVQDDPAKVVKESVLAVAKNKPAGDGKNYAPDVVKERRKTMLPKYKTNNKAPSVGKSNVLAELHKDKVLDVVSKDKPKGNASSVVMSKDKRKENSEKEALFQKDKALNVVLKDKPDIPKKKKDKDKALNASSELPKKKDKADIPKDKHKVHSKVPVLRSKPEVKVKASVCEDVKRGSDSNSDSVDEEKLRRMLRKFKKIKEEDSSSESGLKSNKKCKKKEKHSNEESGLKSNKKGKKKEKQLTPEEVAHEEYLRKFPTIRTRTTSNSLFSAIREARVDMWSFLQGNRVTFETVIMSKITPSNINDNVIIPIGGISLFSLDVRPIEHEFVRMWVNQFYPKSLKDIRLNNVASKVISAHQWIDVCREIAVSDQKSIGVAIFTVALKVLFQKAEEKLATICSERVFLEDLLMKASSVYPHDRMFVKL